MALGSTITAKMRQSLQKVRECGEQRRWVSKSSLCSHYLYCCVLTLSIQVTLSSMVFAAKTIQLIQTISGTIFMSMVGVLCCCAQ